MNIRCSSLPIIMACGPASEAPELRIETGDDEGADGRAVHAVLAAHINGQDLDPADAAALDGADIDQVRILSAIGRRMWAGLSRRFPEPITEVPMQAERGFIVLTGRADVMAVADRIVRINDFKSGWRSDNFEDQLKGYAWLGLQYFPDADSAYCTVAWLRDQVDDAETYSRAELDLWHDRLVERVHDKTYRPGLTQCKYCRRALECPGRRQLVQSSALTLLMGHDGGWQLPDDPAEQAPIITAIYERAKLLEKVSGDALDMVRAAVALAGGTLPMADGRELILDSQETRKIDWPKAKAVLTDEIPEHELDQCITVGKGKAVKAVRANATGKKKDAEESFLSRLEDAGALIIDRQDRLECRRAVKQIESIGA